MEWISVKDQEPPKDRPILAVGFERCIVSGSEKFFPTTRSVIIEWDFGGWILADDSYGESVEPTHWMPLPPPPTAKASEGE